MLADLLKMFVQVCLDKKFSDTEGNLLILIPDKMEKKTLYTSTYNGTENILPFQERVSGFSKEQVN